MAFIVLFSVILLAWTLPVGIGAFPSVNNCIVKISSKYSSESQSCSSVLDSAKNMAKVNVCTELLQLFEEICSFEFNRSVRLNPLPEPKNVWKENCVLLCAELDLQYTLRLVDINSSSCKTLCTADPEAVAVLWTLHQLKNLTAELKKGEQMVVTVTNSTSVPMQQSTLSSKVETAMSNETDVESTTGTADLTTKGESMDAKVPNAKVPQVLNSTSEQLQQFTSPSNAAGNTSSPKEDVKTAATASRRMSPLPTRSVENSATTAAGNTSSPKEEDVKTAATASRRMSPLTTKSVKKSATTAAGNTSSPKEEDEKTTTTASRRMSPLTTKSVEKSATTAAGNTSSPKEEDEKTTTTESDYALDGSSKEKELGYESENANEEDYGSDKDDDAEFGKEDKPGKSKKMDGDDDEQPLPEDRLSKTDEKDETPSSYHFLIYFLAFIVLCVAAYIIFHNKHKIIAFIIEGKQGRRGGRPSTKQYTPLKSKVEDVMPFIEKSTTQSNYIY